MSAGPGLGAAVTEDAARGEALLYDGETILLEIKPSIAWVVLGALGHLAAIAILTTITWWLSARAWIPVEARVVITAGVFLFAARLLWQTLDWIFRSYILTDRRVISLSGVLRRYNFTAPLRTIQHIQVYRSIPERLLGLGSVGFATAGTDVVETWWLVLNRPHEATKAVRDAIERYGRAS